jgi:hypothetical protein
MDTFGLVEWGAFLFVLMVLAAPAILVSLQHAGHWLRVRLRSRHVSERIDVYVCGNKPTQAR